VNIAQVKEILKCLKLLCRSNGAVLYGLMKYFAK
jgi:hypothetical protein